MIELNRVEFSSRCVVFRWGNPTALFILIAFDSSRLLASRMISGLWLDQLQLVPLSGDTGPRRDQHGTQIFCHLHPGPMSIAWSQFLNPATIQTRQIQLGFYPSEQICQMASSLPDADFARLH
jgi:hypothetical protein